MTMNDITEQKTWQGIHRQIAIKTSIRTILDGMFIAKEGWEPHIIRTKGMDISRVNILGVIVAKQVQNAMLNYEHCLIDDGTGKITLRSFNDMTIFNRVGVGDVCLVIGRPREYGGEIYIVPEIVRPMENPAWLSLRKMELAALDSDRTRVANLQASTPEPAEQVKQTIEPIQQSPPASQASDETMPLQATSAATPQLSGQPSAPEPRIFGEADVLHLLRDMDDGGGVSAGDLIAKCNDDQAEDIVQRLLQKGDVFEIRPGQIKILE